MHPKPKGGLAAWTQHVTEEEKVIGAEAAERAILAVADLGVICTALQEHPLIHGGAPRPLLRSVSSSPGTLHATSRAPLTGDWRRVFPGAEGGPNQVLPSGDRLDIERANEPRLPGFQPIRREDLQAVAVGEGGVERKRAALGDSFEVGDSSYLSGEALVGDELLADLPRGGE